MKPDSPPRKPAIFLHIQKTAGTSIVDLIREAYGESEVISHGDYLLGCRYNYLDDSSDPNDFDPTYFSNKSFISGHFGYDFAKQLMHDRYFFTLLRDPIDRILSYYYFCRTRSPKEYEIYAIANENSLDQFLALGLEHPLVKACIWNNQTWQLAIGYGSKNYKELYNSPPEKLLDLALKHLPEFSYMGFVETFESDRNNILKALNVPIPTEKIVSNRNLFRPKLQNHSPHTMMLLKKLTLLDQVLYEKAWIHRKSIPGKILNKINNIIL